MSLDKLRTWEVIKTGGGGTTPSKERSTSPCSNAGRIRNTTVRRTVKSEGGRFDHSAGEEGEDEGASASASTSTSGWERGGKGSGGDISPSGTRLGRSKSLHQPGGPDLPVPPPRRRRPGSVQLASPSKEAFIHPPTPPATAALGSSATSGFPTLGRRGSHSHVHGIDSLHKAVANMRPGFESARAKVEGKLIPSGYGKWREERLVDGEEEIDGYTPLPGANTNTNTSTSIISGRGRSANRRTYGSDEEEEENVEEGWRPLRG
jgi:hypothetical protein